ncbi:hypothetical protein ACFL1P_00890 [Patescibacteria group bacterium]
MGKDSDRDILLVSVFTFLTVLSWIFFELVKTAKTTTVKSTVTQVITPLDPKLEKGILNVLEQKNVY